MKNKSFRGVRATIAAGTVMTFALTAAHAQAPAATPSADGAAKLEEVVVTAQKRAENIQDVPISISVVRGEALVKSGAAQLTDFAGYLPGLQVDNSGTPGRSTLSLRGIVPLGANVTVGTYLDDAPLGSSTSQARASEYSLELLPYDIERIEVLRGPQGTLYGASSIGGLIKYTTVQPNLDELSARAGTEIFALAHASDPGYSGQAFVNAPIVAGTLGMTASYAYRKSPGWIDNEQTGARDQNGYDQQGGRISLAWRPTEEFTATVSGIWQNIEADNDTIVAQGADGVSIGNGRSNYNYIPEPFDSTLKYFAAGLSYNAGFATLSSTTTFSRTHSDRVTDGTRVFGIVFPYLTDPPGLIPEGLAPLQITLDLDKYTEEVRLSSPSSDRFEWLLGGFYTDEKAENHQLVSAQDFAGERIAAIDPAAIVSAPSKYSEYAVFGNATVKFGERFDITGGIRWAQNHQSSRQISTIFGQPADFPPGRSSEGVFTYSVSPQFHVNRDTMLYARVATGYRPGGPNIVYPGVPPTIDSDTLTDYEIGLKSSLIDRTLSLDVAVFDMEWKDIQIDVDFGGVVGEANGASARSRGVEGSLVWWPLDGLSISANGAYTEAELTADAFDAIGGLNGDSLPHIPKWSGSFSADYRFAIGSALAGVGGGVRHTGSRESGFPGSGQPLGPVALAAYTAVDLNASVTFSEKWTLRAYVRNLTDSIGPVSRTVQGTQLGGDVVTLTPLQARTLGLAAEVSF